MRGWCAARRPERVTAALGSFAPCLGGLNSSRSAERPEATHGGINALKTVGSIAAFGASFKPHRQGYLVEQGMCTGPVAASSLEYVDRYGLRFDFSGLSTHQAARVRVLEAYLRVRAAEWQESTTAFMPYA